MFCLHFQEVANPQIGWDIYLPMWANTSSNAIVTAMFDMEEFDSLLRLIWSVKIYSSDNHLAIFDMTEDKKERKAKNQPDEFRNMQSVSSVLNLDFHFYAIQRHRIYK